MKILAKHYIVEDADIGDNTVIRDFVNIFKCKIGKNCKIAAFVEIQKDVVIGDNCAIAAFVFIPTGVNIEDEVFIGPHVCFTNDMKPRAINPGWKTIPTTVKKGAKIVLGDTVAYVDIADITTNTSYIYLDYHDRNIDDSRKFADGDFGYINHPF